MDTLHPFPTIVQNQLILRRLETGLKGYLRLVFPWSVHPKATEIVTKRCRACEEEVVMLSFH